MDRSAAAWTWAVMAVVVAGRAAAGDYLGDMAWPRAAESLPDRVVIIPFAAGAKQHGPHLPMNTDQQVMDYLLEAAVAERDVIVSPPILHGWFPAFRSYPGTEIADPAVFQAYVMAVARSLINSGARRLVFLNTGIGRATGLPLSVVARDIKADHGVPTLVLSWDDLESAAAEPLYDQLRGGHADEGETSIMLALRPEQVQMDQAAPDYRDPPRPQIGYAPGRFDRESETGQFGDPTLATRAKGEALLDLMRTNLLLALDQFDAATRVENSTP